MSREIELLKEVLKVFDSVYSRDLINEIKELLAESETKPEQEPVAWFYDYDGTTWVKLKELDLPNMHHSVTNIRPLYLAPLKDVNVDLLEALQDVLEDLKLRASLTDEPNVLNVSRGKLIKAEKAIAKAKGLKDE